MLDKGKESLEKAFFDGYAVGAFSVYNLEGALAVCRAAEDEGLPVILQAGSSAFRYSGLRPLASLAVAVAETSGARVGVHLDHSRDLNEIRECLALGYTSVMFDGSALPFEENIARTREAVRVAHDAGVWIEGELGALGGDEDRSGEAETGEMTDPDAAARFAEETGVDALAVGIGNVHGFTPHEVILDLERLAEIHELVPVPLVLHGASGLPEEQVRRAISLGVSKINVNAEIRRSFLSGLRKSANDPSVEGDDLTAFLKPAIEGMRSTVGQKIGTFARMEPSGRRAAHLSTGREQGGYSQ